MSSLPTSPVPTHHLVPEGRHAGAHSQIVTGERSPECRSSVRLRLPTTTSLVGHLHKHGTPPVSLVYSFSGLVGRCSRPAGGSGLHARSGTASATLHHERRPVSAKIHARSHVCGVPLRPTLDAGAPARHRNPNSRNSQRPESGATARAQGAGRKRTFHAMKAESRMRPACDVARRAS